MTLVIFNKILYNIRAFESIWKQTVKVDLEKPTHKNWVTLEFSRHHGNLKPKRFDFCIEYKPFDRTCQLHYHWLGLFGLLEEINIESCIVKV